MDSGAEGGSGGLATGTVRGRWCWGRRAARQGRRRRAASLSRPQGGASVRGGDPGGPSAAARQLRWGDRAARRAARGVCFCVYARRERESVLCGLRSLAGTRLYIPWLHLPVHNCSRLRRSRRHHLARRRRRRSPRRPHRPAAAATTSPRAAGLPSAHHAARRARSPRIGGGASRAASEASLEAVPAAPAESAGGSGAAGDAPPLV